MLLQVDERNNDGLKVEMCYDDAYDEVVIYVMDSQFNDYFTLRPPHDRAKEYFDHPYAFRPTSTPVADALSPYTLHR